MREGPGFIRLSVVAFFLVSILLFCSEKVFSEEAVKQEAQPAVPAKTEEAVKTDAQPAGESNTNEPMKAEVKSPKALQAEKIFIPPPSSGACETYKKYPVDYQGYEKKYFQFKSEAVSNMWFGYRMFPGHDTKFFTGNWWGYRDKLKEQGIEPTGNYVADFQGNPVGGRVYGFRYNHSIDATLKLDFEKMYGFQGTQFYISMIERAGKNLSKDCISNTFTASSLYGSEQARLYFLCFEKAMFDNKAFLRIGRISTGDDFGWDPIYWVFPNNAIDGNPICLPINVPGYTTYPTATWGTRLKVNLTDKLYTKFGAYNGDWSVGRMAAHGMDFTLRLDRGVYMAQEIGYKPNTGKGDKGLPGNYKIGAYWDTYKHYKDYYEDINGNSYVLTGLPQKEHSGNYGMYFHIEQMLYREGGPESHQGFIPFAVICIAPVAMNKFPLFVDGGLLYRGPFPKRDEDTIGVGFAYGKWSGDIYDSQCDQRDILGMDVSPQKYEIMLDFTYKYIITDSTYIQPDMQYIIFPGGTGATANAYVLGFRLGVTF